MNYDSSIMPSASDYQAAIQNPDFCFKDEELASSSPIRYANGLPSSASGRFAIVFPLENHSKNIAVRCFTIFPKDQEKRYRLIDEVLKRVKLPFFVNFTYKEEGIHLKNKWYPVLKMDWIEGKLLDQYIFDNRESPYQLEVLKNELLRIFKALKGNSIAHCDLQPGNIIVTDKGIKLVDYDGLFVPGMEGMTRNEMGTPNYQHPALSRDDFNEEMDEFSIWTILLSITALQLNPGLLTEKTFEKDYILFQQSDFKDPDSSQIFKKLKKIRDQKFQKLLEEFSVMCKEQIFEEYAIDHDWSVKIRAMSVKTTSGKSVPAMVFVEKGGFTRGDTWEDGYDDEKPTHKVTFTYDFGLGRYETTFDEYDAFCEATGRRKPDDRGWGRGQRPVIYVSWNDAIAYCNWLSEKEGLPVAYRLRGESAEGQMIDANGNVTTDITKVIGYRLPTEAEWEYAARGGNKSKGYKYAGSDNVNDVAWYWQNSGEKYLTVDWDWDTIMENNCRTQEVGKKAPNELGLYDMSGNVWEWCSDWYGGYSSSAQTNPYNSTFTYGRVARGGSWYNSATNALVADHSYGSPTGTGSGIGFRICRTVPYERKNRPSLAPYNSSPSDNEINQLTTVTLSWECSDPDGETVTYDVYFDTNNNPTTKVSTNQSGRTLSRANLSYGTTYYWRVVAKNSKGATTEGPVWEFTTQRNRPPTAPSSPNPTNNATNQPLTLNLSWDCSDPDGDTVTYDVYFDTNTSPTTKLSTNQSGKTLSRSNLSYGTTYYWRVVAKNSKGATTEGPVWRFTTQSAPTTTSYTSSSIVPSMVLVDGGSFTMGDTWGRGYRDEKPTHKETFTYDFYIGKYETTFDEYDAFCDATGRSKPKDEGWGRKQRPVINVTWWDAIDYCNWLSKKEKLPKAYDKDGNFLDKDGRITTDPSKVFGYRLPTEAEWEYAARGGNKSTGYKYAGSDNVNDVAWYLDNAGRKTQEVGKKAPNELGLYDMSGNVWEWCSDLYGGYSSSSQINPYNSIADSRRVMRGGSGYNDATYTRVANRFSLSPAYTNYNIGFRIARRKNRPSLAPCNPSPSDNEINQPTTVTLSWECSDPDGDTVTYDVYFDTNTSPTTKLSTNQSGKTLSRSNLSYGTTYYWRVVAKNSKGATTEGPVWRFSTQDIDLSSYKPSIVLPPMVLVEKGGFTMGDTWEDGYDDEKPTHKVTFTYDFGLGRYETTFDEYDAFCKATGRSKPSDLRWGRGQRPVINVSWYDAVAYCNWLSEKEGLPVAYRLRGESAEGQMIDANGNVTTDITKVIGYRLPTEAEWEYAARGGNKSKGYKYAGSDNVGDVAWYSKNSGSKTQEVGKKAPNELGLYDMSGNVWEWCSDWYGQYPSASQFDPYTYNPTSSGPLRVYRGGSWDSFADGGRVTFRGNGISSDADYRLGFRICRCMPYSIGDIIPYCKPYNPNPSNNAINHPIKIRLSWECGDADGNPLTYDIYFDTRANPTTKVSSGLSEKSLSITDLSYNTTYYWKVIAKNEQGASTEGPIYRFTTKRALKEPSKPRPSNEVANQPVEVRLSWECGDLNGNPLTYDIYFDTNSKPKTKVSTNQSEKTLTRTNLAYNTTYYWKVVAKNSKGETTVGPVWKFTTTRPPMPPSNQIPSNYEKKQPSEVLLSWDCSDLDGNPLTYDIYFDTNSKPKTKVSTNQSEKTLNITNLSYNTTYYWKVVAKNNKGAEAEGPIWRFTTQRYPDVPSSPGPANNETNQSVETEMSWECDDPDGNPLTYDIYFDTNPNPTKKVSSNQVGKTLIGSNLSYNTTYYWKVVARNNYGVTEGPIWKFATIEALGLMVFVEKGSFTMGDTWGDGGSDEKPTHKVTFNYNFHIGKYEVTFDEYDAFCEATGKSKPSDNSWGRGTRPVINVSWNDAIAYCNWLSEKEKLPKAYDNNGTLLDKDGRITTDPSKVVGYRLPTEAEWEYAARGGNKSKGHKYSGSDNVGEVAWYNSNLGSKTQEVGKKTPNELGIYDMSGNVWEWCSDWYGNYSSSAQTNPYNSTTGSGRVFRGGSWGNNAAGVRVANRGSCSPTITFRSIGFRICRTWTYERKNRPSLAPYNPSPSDNEINQLTTVTLSWECSDPDGETVTYDVYFDTNNNPTTKVSTNQSGRTLSRANLSYGTTYYWRVVAKNSKGVTTEGPVWKFTTQRNRPPTAPSSPSPTNNATNQPLTLNLSWDCSDPDGNPLTYDIYFDTSPNPTIKISTSQSGKTLSRSNLSYGTTYYWRVVAKNSKGATTEGPVWEFTTQRNRPPTAPSSPSPTNNATNQPLTLNLSWDCSDPDGNPLTYDIYFDTSPNPTIKISTSQSGKTLSRSNLSYGTTYYWRVVAKNSKGVTTEGPVWRFTTQSVSKSTVQSPSSKFPERTVLVEKGGFTMGDTLKVTLTYNFHIGKYEVTFEEYDAFCETTDRSKPSNWSWGRGTRPVINVSWWDAIAYCNWLSEKKKLPKAYDSNGNLLDKDGRVTTDITKVLGYRLPTEAEWEYAARGGNKSKGYKYAGSDNVGDVAWYRDNSGSKTQEVGKRVPNELGIYDMSGNVWEWCSDLYGDYPNPEQTNPYNSTAGSYRVIRGGSWGSDATYVRVANRSSNSPTGAFSDLGFRICRTVP